MRKLHRFMKTKTHTAETTTQIHTLIAALDSATPKGDWQNRLIWIYGKTCSGKSTLARALFPKAELISLHNTTLASLRNLLYKSGALIAENFKPSERKESLFRSCVDGSKSMDGSTGNTATKSYQFIRRPLIVTSEILPRDPAIRYRRAIFIHCIEKNRAFSVEVSMPLMTSI